MQRQSRGVAISGAVLLAATTGGAAWAQKPGGILKMYSPDSPASMSIHEEATVFAEGPMMGVFNNLVIFDQHGRRTAWPRSCPIWRPAGRGTKTARR
jgi:peptide/nickel transport system substrate-binding protein